MGPAIFFASIARNQDQLGSDAVWGLPEAPAGVVEFQSRSGLAGEETSLVITIRPPRQGDHLVFVHGRQNITAMIPF
jgi:hypothetical protein